jgi:hypothetical protein
MVDSEVAILTAHVVLHESRQRIESMRQVRRRFEPGIHPRADPLNLLHLKCMAVGARPVGVWARQEVAGVSDLSAGGTWGTWGTWGKGINSIAAYSLPAGLCLLQFAQGGPLPRLKVAGEEEEEGPRGRSYIAARCGAAGSTWTLQGLGCWVAGLQGVDPLDVTAGG